MSDPFSIASGAAGLISLGLTLCKGLTEYISAVKSHGEDVRNIERKLNTLQMFLEAVDVTLKELPHLQGGQPPGDVVKVVEAALGQSQDGMMKLAGFLQKCSGETPATSSSATPPSSLQRMRKKSVYYFRRGALKELEQLLDSVQGLLNLSLTLLNVRFSASQSREYRQITESMSLSSTQLINLQSSVVSLEKHLSDTSEAVTTVSESLETTQESWQRAARQVQEMATSLQIVLQKLILLLVLIVIPLLRGSFLLMRRAYRDVPRSILSLSTDNILFEDVLGRSFSLQFSLVSEWKVFETFLMTRFEDIPGESFVNSGRYHLLVRRENIILPKSRQGWANSIFPGAKVVMYLQADGHIPERCPKCGTLLNRGGGIVMRCETPGCWADFLQSLEKTNKIQEWRDLLGQIARQTEMTTTQEAISKTIASPIVSTPRTIDLGPFNRLTYSTRDATSGLVVMADIGLSSLKSFVKRDNEEDRYYFSKR